MTTEHKKEKDTQETTPPQQPPAAPSTPQTDTSALAIISAVLGIMSLTGPGLLLGIPAIITGAIALKKKQGERGLSITGLVTGIISTVISLLVIVGLVLLFIFAASRGGELRQGDHYPHRGGELRFDENRT